jgi:hypothetical protein
LLEHGRTDPVFRDIASEVVNDSLDNVLSDARKQEKKIIDKNWDFYNGDQAKYIEKYVGEKQTEFDSKIKTEFNYTRLVVNQYIKGVFGKPVKISFPDNSAAKAVWEAIVGAYNFDWFQFGKKIQRIEELSYMSLVLPRYNKERDQIYFNVYRGDDVYLG